MKTRSEEEITSLIIYTANADDRIRAVLLNGSRADPNSTRDRFQDFDVVYVVSELDSFLQDRRWIDIFGERLILQVPEEMSFGEKDGNYSLLMLFKDGNRIDLTILPAEKLRPGYKVDSLTVVLLDKDRLFEEIPPSGDRDYHITRPTAKQFTDCCNEFWWVSTYVAKGLWRNELTYAKDMLEIPVRSMFMKLIEWHIGICTDFRVSFGKSGKNMKAHLSEDLYAAILSTYPDSNPQNIWNSLFNMTGIFSELAGKIALALNFHYNIQEEYNVKAYLKEVRSSASENEPGP